MQLTFKTIGLFGKPNQATALSTVVKLAQFLANHSCQLIIEVTLANALQKLTSAELPDHETVELDEMGDKADLVIVVGGDGNMLGAARTLSKSDTTVIGVNRGNLGFLTDLDPESFESTLLDVMQGEFDTEQRFLLEMTVWRDGDRISTCSAMNEVVLHSEKVAHMIEFEVYANDNFMFSQRADGLIACTPTGSTAYSLSGGGPILTPDLEVICLQPMFPHTLTNRPIVVDANSEIRLVMASRKSGAAVTCDGHVSCPVQPGDEITVRKQQQKLNLLHPKNHSYFKVLRQKLNWGSKLY